MNGKCYFKTKKDLIEFKEFLNKVLFDYCANNPGWIYDFMITKEGRMFLLEVTVFQY